jgi:hypothetical protein
MEAVILSASVNRLTKVDGLRCPPPLIKIEKTKSPNPARNRVWD